MLPGDQNYGEMTPPCERFQPKWVYRVVMGAEPICASFSFVLAAISDIWLDKLFIGHVLGKHLRATISGTLKLSIDT